MSLCIFEIIHSSTPTQIQIITSHAYPYPSNLKFFSQFFDHRKNDHDDHRVVFFQYRANKTLSKHSNLMGIMVVFSLFSNKLQRIIKIERQQIPPEGIPRSQLSNFSREKVYRFFGKNHQNNPSYSFNKTPLSTRYRQKNTEMVIFLAWSKPPGQKKPHQDHTNQMIISNQKTENQKSRLLRFV